jgi:UDP-2-acetamido-2,6-beta-L-arabino-hexul-4-ose reductase
MRNVIVTGAGGFVGRNICAELRLREDVELAEVDISDPPEKLDSALRKTDFIFHLAGVNRSKDPKEFEIGNAVLVADICRKLRKLERKPTIVLTSSIQADLDNPYGRSKRHGEAILERFSEETGASCIVYRLKNLFGKWCQPDYNSVTATFCHNIANDLPIQISNRERVIELTHIDDVVSVFLSELEDNRSGFNFADPLPSKEITLGELADKIKFFKMSRKNLLLPDVQNEFENRLYSTYLSYLPDNSFEYGLDIKSDLRGSLAEFIKSPSLGQVFVSRTKPGVTRGDHYHHTKTEKFLVLVGMAIIRFRHIESDKVIEYKVCGEDYRVLDIPPAYTHSIENVGEGELVTLFWASEIFNPDRPDTYYQKVCLE